MARLGVNVDHVATLRQARGGSDPETFAAESYDVIKLIADVLNKAPDSSSESLKAGLYKTQNYAGASGTITFDQHGDVIKPMAIKRIDNGTAVVVQNR